MIVVSDSSALIALSRIGKLDILKSLYKEITIPEAVAKEILSGVTKKIDLNKLSWIKTKSISQPLGADILSVSLGCGESETIALALELKAGLVILDESAARNIAELLDLRFTGILGVLLKAKQKRLISSVKESLDNLIKHGFRLSRQLYNEVLELAGEK